MTHRKPPGGTSPPRPPIPHNFRRAGRPEGCPPLHRFAPMARAPLVPLEVAWFARTESSPAQHPTGALKARLTQCLQSWVTDSPLSSQRVGISFSHRHAVYLGLDPIRAFEQLVNMGFGVVRISAYWDEIAARGFRSLHTLLETAGRAGQPLVLTVGMKAIRWPEFYVPQTLASLTTRDLQGPLSEFISTTVEHCKDSPAIVAWQVENEPLNRSGPNRRWIPLYLLAAEVEAVRKLDARPLILNAFRHFTLASDWMSRPWPWTSVEQQLLRLLDKGDVLGLDIYTRIAWTFSRISRVSTARASWPNEATAVADQAHAANRNAWVTEAQAEPWGPGSFGPADVAAVYSRLANGAFERVLLWGAEHWLWCQARGDTSWLSQVQTILEATA
jgi:hypothetical protein